MFRPAWPIVSVSLGVATLAWMLEARGSIEEVAQRLIARRTSLGGLAQVKKVMCCVAEYETLKQFRL